MAITKEEYSQRWEPWRRALIIKVLGHSISFRILEQKIKDLSKFDRACKLVDLDRSYCLAGKWSDARKGDGAAAPPSAAVTGGAGQASVQTYKDNTTLVAQNKGKQPVDDYVRAGATFSADLVVPNSATIFRV
ncbi:hypothetical protein M9H77_20801 [Catharanthus roseus]|uniref:Uncharacterized protein n=1 Tax=Catharanthus roseus TaxID=4058 RepID=A0ACC0APW5_CATRO|nr:hypothetical protein M9H77_20801 [Catharanthus roseus]